MILNLYLDDEQAELLTALADHEEISVDECASELINDLLARIWQQLREQFYN